MTTKTCAGTTYLPYHNDCRQTQICKEYLSSCCLRFFLGLYLFIMCLCCSLFFSVFAFMYWFMPSNTIVCNLVPLGRFLLPQCLSCTFNNYRNRETNAISSDLSAQSIEFQLSNLIVVGSSSTVGHPFWGNSMAYSIKTSVQ